jgi:hypothetical protein
MNLNINKTRVTSCIRKTNILVSEYNLCKSLLNHMDAIKYFRVFLESNVYFHHHMDYVFSQAIKLLVTLSFSSFDSLLMLYFTLVRSKLELNFD